MHGPGPLAMVDAWPWALGHGRCRGLGPENGRCRAWGRRGGNYHFDTREKLEDRRVLWCVEREEEHLRKQPRLAPAYGFTGLQGYGSMGLRIHRQLGLWG